MQERIVAMLSGFFGTLALLLVEALLYGLDLRDPAEVLRDA